MNRPCFLCHNQVDLVYNQTWVLPGIKTSNIGFSICSNCGSVLQSPSVSFDEMMTYYESVAVYTNPGRKELPSDSKIRDVGEQIQFIKRGIGALPKSALQIGSSDGYTLSQFRKAGVKRVLGIEPGLSACELAKRLYDVETLRTSAEEFTTEESFELILMTHVLEHLYAPQSVLEKCYDVQKDLEQAYIYIEVPLLTHENAMCPGFFSFEHINYYTRGNVLRSLEQAGYYCISIIEHYQSNLSPIIGILASTVKSQNCKSYTNDYQENRRILLSYRAREIKEWQNKLDAIQPFIKDSKRFFIWGAGIHTSQLFANTNLLDFINIFALVDSSQLKWGIQQGDWQCKNPKLIDWREGDVVLISSYASEQEIFDALSWLRDKGVKTLRLHSSIDPRANQ